MIWKPVPDMGGVSALHQFPPSFLWGSCAAPIPLVARNSCDPGYERINPERHPGLEGSSDDSGRGAEHLFRSINQAARRYQNSLRVPLDWSALQPEEGSWDQTVGQLYQDLFAEVRSSGIVPLVSLFQGAAPHWFLSQGGWMADASVNLFNKYVSLAADWFGDLSSHWVTIETPLYYAYLVVQHGLNHPDIEGKSTFSTLFTNLMTAHESAYEILHSRRRDCQVSFSTWYWPALSGCSDGNHSHSRKWLRSAESILNSGRTSTGALRINVESAFRARDYIGLNYPSLGFLADGYGLTACESEEQLWKDPSRLSGLLKRNEGSVNGALRWSRSFSLPVYLTGHTIFTGNDLLRKLILFSTIREIWSCVNESWPVRGYFFNNPSDRLNPTDSFSPPLDPAGKKPGNGEGEIYSPEMLYMEICRQRGISSDTAKVFTPDLLDHYFPGRGPRDLSMVGG